MKSILIFIPTILVLCSLQTHVCWEEFRNIFVNLGSHARLRCSHYTDREMRFEWKRSEKVIRKVAELNFKNITKSQLGSYSCTWTKNGSFVGIDYIVLYNIPEINFLGVDSSNTITISETQNVEIECKVEGNFYVEWENINQLIIGEPKLSIKYITEETNLSPYICIITPLIIDRYLSMETFRKELFINTKTPQVSVEILPSESLVMSGLIHRKCVGFNLSQSTETFRYLWLDSIGRVVSRQNILEVPIVDESVLGHYICKYRAFNARKDFESITEVKLSHVESPSDLDISITSNPSTFLLKGSLSMKCIVHGNYKSVLYTWYNYGKIVVQNEMLHLENLQKTDQGVYTCFAKGLKMDGERFLLEKQVNQSIKAFDAENVELVEGEGTQVGLNLGLKKELHCYVDQRSGKNGKDVKWFFESNQLNYAEMRNLQISRHDSFFGSILLIEEVELSHEGIFMCKLDLVEKRVNIVVIEEFKLLTINPKLLRIEEGEAAELNCQLKHNDKLTNRDIEWYFTPKDGRNTVDLNIKRWKRRDSIIVDKTRFISIINAKYTDSGFYTCRTRSGLSDTGELVVNPHNKEIVHITLYPTSHFQTANFKFPINCDTAFPLYEVFGEPEFLINDQKDFDRNRWKVESIKPYKKSITAVYGLKYEEDLTKITCRYKHREKSIFARVHNGCDHIDDIVTCPNNKCKALGIWCANIEDCFETNERYADICYKCDPTQIPCGPNNGTEKTQEYIDVYKKCDAIRNDCSNGFDELNCPKNKNCDTQYFKCKDRHFHVHYNRVCDGYPNCNDWSDEESCSLKYIIETNQNRIYAKIGHDVALKCTVVGHPIPSVIWRHNWFCLPDLKRMTVTNYVKSCNEIESTLTIKDFRSEDVAVYNCEALGPRLSGMSKPIFVVIDSET